MSVYLRMGVTLGVLWLLAGVPLQANESTTPTATPPALEQTGQGGVRLAPAVVSDVPLGTVLATDSARMAKLRRAVLRAWSLPARSLDDRVDRTLHAGHKLGMRNLEAPARAVLVSTDLGEPLERAQAAVRLAPALPAARAALARALWDDDQWSAGFAELGEAALAVPGHLEAVLWTRAMLTDVAFVAVAGGALLFLALVAVMAMPRWVRNLSVIREDLPTASRFALLASLLLLPTAAGEGPAGLVAALVVVAAAYGKIWHRCVVALAAAAFLVALYPLLDEAAEARAVIGNDTTALAAHSAEHGFPSADELARVQLVAGEDPLAARALALRSKRMGNLDAAADRYFAILEDDGAHVTADLLNNAAGVALARGELDDAIDYYEQAAGRAGSTLVLFNLSQAYGKAVRLEEQDLALAQAQAIDSDEVAQLAAEFGSTALGLVADIPIPAAVATDRLEMSHEGRRLALRERGRVAPGWIGAGLLPAFLVFGMAFVLGAGVGFVFSRTAPDDDDHYSDIARILQNRGGDSAARMARIAQIREQQRRTDGMRQIASLAIPGAAGVIGGRPVLGWIGATIAALVVSLLWHSSGSVPDPLVMGGLPAAAVPLAVLGFGLLYLAMLGFTLAVKERG